MIKDRLQEFQEKSKGYNSQSDERRRDGGGGVGGEKQPLLYSQEDWDGVEDFLLKVEALQNDLRLLDTYITDVNQKHSEILVKPHQDQKTKDEHDQATAAFKALSESLRIALKKAELETDAIRKQRKTKADYDPDAIDLRIRTTHIRGLTQQLMDSISRFSADQVRFREKCEKRIHDYLSLTGGKLDQAEIDKMVETGNIYSHTTGLLYDTNKAKEVLREVTQRYEDIQHAEKLITDLHELFTDLAGLVEMQGEEVDSIERHVMDSVDVTERAARKMREAQEAKDRYRRRKVILTIVILVVLLIVGAVIAISICVEPDKC